MNTLEYACISKALQVLTIKKLSKLSETFRYKIIPILLQTHYDNLSDIIIFSKLCKSITNTDMLTRFQFKTPN